MFYQIYAMTLKGLRAIFRDKAVLAVLFLLPIVFVVVMTYAGVGNQGIRPAEILVVNQDAGPIAGRMIQRLEQDKRISIDVIDNHPSALDQADALLLKRGSPYELVLVFPKQFTENLLSEKPDRQVVVRFVADPATGGENLYPVERLIETHVMHVAGAFEAAQVNLQTLRTEMSNAAGSDQEALTAVYQHFKAALPTIDTETQTRVSFTQVAPRGVQSTSSITAKEQNVPGYTIFGVFFIVQVIGNTLLREKENGTMARLRASPTSKALLLVGKLVPFYIVNIIQVIFMFAFGHFVYHISLGHSPTGLFIVTLATAATANALGLLIAAISKTTEQMGPLSGLILVCLATVGGIFIPYFEMPSLLQKLSFFTPQAWSLKGFQDILIHGASWVSVLPTAGILLPFSLVFYGIALLRFRFQ